MGDPPFQAILEKPVKSAPVKPTNWTMPASRAPTASSLRPCPPTINGTAAPSGDSWNPASESAPAGEEPRKLGKSALDGPDPVGRPGERQAEAANLSAGSPSPDARLEPAGADDVDGGKLVGEHAERSEGDVDNLRPHPDPVGGSTPFHTRPKRSSRIPTCSLSAGRASTRAPCRDNGLCANNIVQQ